MTKCLNVNKNNVRGNNNDDKLEIKASGSAKRGGNRVKLEKDNKNDNNYDDNDNTNTKVMDWTQANSLLDFLLCVRSELI